MIFHTDVEVEQAQKFCVGLKRDGNLERAFTSLHLRHETLIKNLEIFLKSQDHVAMATPDRVLRGVVKNGITLMRAVIKDCK